MRGVVVIGFIFLIVPGAVQDVSVSTVQPSTNHAASEPGVPIADGSTTTTVPKTTVSGNTTMAPDTTVSGNTTMAPKTTVSGNTTMAPDTTVNGSTTMAPDTTVNGSTTMAPDTTVTAEMGTSETPKTGISEAPKTGTPEMPKTSPAEPQSCAPGVCGNGTTCLQLYQTYECQCPLNYYYNASDKTCSGGDSFYGEFSITGVNFNPNPESQEYTELYNKVLNQSVVSLSGLSGYQGTVIIQISLIPSKTETRRRRSTGDASAKVSHMFSKGAPTSADAVTKAIQDNAGDATTYQGKSICDGFYCDAETTQCEATADGQGATCTCKDGKYSSSAEHTVTTCRDCSPQCYQTENKYCNLKTPAEPKCECRPEYKSNGDKCQKCDFGYSGVDCADNFLLILVIVAAVLGAAVIALLGAVIGVSVRSKKGKKYEDRTALIKKDETALGDGSPAPARIFPTVQAKTDLGEVNKAVNVFDDNEEYSRNFPKRDYDENNWYEMDRKTRNY